MAHIQRSGTKVVSLILINYIYNCNGIYTYRVYIFYKIEVIFQQIPRIINTYILPLCERLHAGRVARY
jgi:hypothetical protein